MHFAWSVHILNPFLFSNPYLKFSGPVSFIHRPKLISSSSHPVVAHGCKERKKLIFGWVHIIFIIIVSENVNKLQSHWNILNWNIIMLSGTSQRLSIHSRTFSVWEILKAKYLVHWSTKRKKQRVGWLELSKFLSSFKYVFYKRYGLYKERRYSYHLPLNDNHSNQWKLIGSPPQRSY